jgi:hypothetical protein
MEKKFEKSKTVKPVCETCVQSVDLKNMYWVNRTGYRSLHCLKCIEENNLIIYAPYVNPRKKKSEK